MNREIACSVYEILRKMGLEEKKEVVCFDGLEERGVPVFTYVSQGQYLIGVKAVSILDNEIKGKRYQRSAIYRTGWYMGKGCGRRTSELPGRTGEPAGLICTNREHREKRAGRNPGSFIPASNESSGHACMHI